MKSDDVQSIVLEALRRAVPGADVDSLDTERDVRDQLDMDSIDVLAFATALSQELGVDIPDTDYPHLMTVDRCTAYLQEKQERRP